MCSKKHIRSFTLIDVLSGLVLMSIVVAMVFYLITSVVKQNQQYAAVRYQLNDYLILKSAMGREASECKQIRNLENGFCFYSDSTEIKYEQIDSYLFRSINGYKDTVWNAVGRIDKYFINQDDEKKQEEVLRGIELHLDLNGQKMTCAVFKDYGLCELMNERLIHGN